MHEFHADRDRAMCTIQSRSIPVLQPTQLRKLSNKNWLGPAALKCFSTGNGGAWLRECAAADVWYSAHYYAQPNQHLYVAMV
jgi:hypothetical protein